MLTFHCIAAWLSLSPLVLCLVWMWPRLPGIRYVAEITDVCLHTCKVFFVRIFMIVVFKIYFWNWSGVWACTCWRFSPGQNVWVLREPWAPETLSRVWRQSYSTRRPGWGLAWCRPLPFLRALRRQMQADFVGMWCGVVCESLYVCGMWASLCV